MAGGKATITEKKMVISDQPELSDRDKSVHVSYISSDQEFNQFVKIALQECPFHVLISSCDEVEPRLLENVLYAYLLDFLMAFDIPLDPLDRERLTLFGAQPYHLVTNS